jgi:hypothetical protein
MEPITVRHMDFGLPASIEPVVVPGEPEESAEARTHADRYAAEAVRVTA